MAIRLYIVPVIGTGATKATARRPKYFTDGTITPTLGWSAMDYGFEPWMLVAADLSGADDVTLAAEPDAFALPFDLSPTLTAPQVANVQNKLEAANLPSGWVNTSLTWTQVVKTVIGVLSFFQRFGAVYAKQNGVAPGSIYGSGITLDSTFGSLSVPIRNAMLSTAVSFGFSTAGLNSGATIRVILKAMADLSQSATFTIGGLTV